MTGDQLGVYGDEDFVLMVLHLESWSLGVLRPDLALDASRVYVMLLVA
jgi:hypothetical protein